MSRREAVPVSPPGPERPHQGPADLRAAFVRALEGEYARLVDHFMTDAGLYPEAAHRRALEDVKELGRQALEELRARGLFPWPHCDMADGGRPGGGHA